MCGLYRSIFRIAETEGAPAARKVFSLQTLPACDDADEPVTDTLVVLVPKPGLDLTRYHGAFASIVLCI